MLTPVQPAGTGNGLAMRAELFRRSAVATGLDLRVVVVPVAGRLPSGVRLLGETIVVPPDPQTARAGIRSLIGDAAWRERLLRAGTLPRLARSASPGLADAVVRALDSPSAAGLHVMRSYLAPLGLAVAERLGARWITVDLDEDDAALAVALGDRDEASAYGRLLAAVGPSFDGLSMAAPAEAAATAERHGLVVDVIPNAVQLPRDVPPRPARGREVSLLFVGNLTYPPNVEAASFLVQRILPELRRRLGNGVRLTLVGPYAPSLESLADGQVELVGFAPDLGPAYARADVVVAPLRIAGGTRIKLLEAFAHGVPVVASPVAAGGLMVAHGRHLLLAQDAPAFAAAVEQLLSSPTLASRLVSHAQQLVRDEYSTEAVMPRICEFFSRAAGRDAPARHYSPSGP